MITTATKIYLLTNAIFVVGISLYQFPDELGLGLIAAPFSLLFSAPLLLVMTVCLWLLHMLKTSPFVCWLLFLAAIAIGTVLPLYWFDGMNKKMLVPVAYASAFISTLLLSKSINSHFMRDQSVKTNIKRKPWTI